MSTPSAAELHVIARALPVVARPYAVGGRRAGLVIVDEVNGFCTVGAGALAPTAPDPFIDAMVVETDRLGRAFAAAGRPIVALLDTHRPGHPEPPYPPHCEIGSGEETLVPALRWLETHPGATLIRKDCINGVIGAIDPATGANRLIDWINAGRLEAVAAVGICTDICVLDFVTTLLSVRNHGLTPTLTDVVAHAPACATYDLPAETVAALGLGPEAAHPRGPAHHVGLYLMASRGAIVSTRIE